MLPTSDEQSPDDAFGRYSEYYDLLYEGKSYAEEADYVAGLISQFCPDAKDVLEFGSGTGRHAVLLAGRGYEVHGVERSATMLDRARARLPGELADRVSFSQGDLRKARLGRRFDAVIALFHVISYQRTNDDLASSFGTVRSHLPDGGVFLFDAWYGPAVLAERPSPRRKRVEGPGFTVTRFAEPTLLVNENVVEVVYSIHVRDDRAGDIREFEERHEMRYLFLPEIEFLAQAHGFRIERAEEWLSGQELGEETWGACFALRAV